MSRFVEVEELIENGKIKIVLPDKCCANCFYAAFKDKMNAYGDIECICLSNGYIHSLLDAQKDLTNAVFETLWGKSIECNFRERKITLYDTKRSAIPSARRD